MTRTTVAAWLLLLGGLHAESTLPLAPAAPLVTFDVSGTFPANMPVTGLTAPNAAFLLEVSFKQSVPVQIESFALQTAIVSGNYTFEGRTYRLTAGSYDVLGGYTNSYNLSLSVSNGARLMFASQGNGPGERAPYPVWFPSQSYRPPATSANPDPQGTLTFLTGDAGPVATAWPLTLTNARNQSISGLVKITDLVGRLVLP